VARQPIFDRDQQVFGYELLFRPGSCGPIETPPPEPARPDAADDLPPVIPFEELLAGKKGFVHFTPELATEKMDGLLSTDAVVVQIPAGKPADEETLDACRRLKEAGHTLAIHRSLLDGGDHPLAELADILRMEFREDCGGEQDAALSSLRARGVAFLAEGVDTAEQFAGALASGYAYFQGSFFAQPAPRRGREIAGNKLAYLRLLNEISRIGISYEEIEENIKQDVALAQKLLRFMNSAWFGLRYEVRSIRHSLVLLGPKEIRKWFSLVALQHVTSDKPHELLVRSIIRAKIAEDLAPLVRMDGHGSELFLMGLFSSIDALTDLPMSEVLERLPICEEIRTALLGGQCAFRTVHDAIVSYEQGDWAAFSQHAAKLHLDEHAMPHIFSEALKWTNQAFAAL
jgi:EAL and modified HD-GYP domain-containing signal transduction protein